jgi:hypothetical protein
MTIIYTVARMNPPTLGHVHLIENMLEEALRRNVKKVHIILSSKVDTKKNPLQPEEKRYILQTYGIPRAKTDLILRFPDQGEAIDHLRVNIMLTHEYSRYLPNDVLGTVQELLVGQRRGEKILFMTGEQGFPVDKGTEVILLDRTKLPISGTMVRAATSYEEFAAFYPGLSERDLDWMYDAIMDLEPTTKEEMPHHYALRSRGGFA